MKEYLLFQGLRYYPSGGWEDFQGAFSSIEEAAAEGEKLCADEYGAWFHVVTIADGLVFTWETP